MASAPFLAEPHAIATPEVRLRVGLVVAGDDDDLARQAMAGSQSPPPAVDHDPSVTRSLLCGPSTPPPPYPVYLSGPVQKGFGRGSKELGCPTANLPDEAVDRAQREDGWGDENGVYFGYAKVGKRRREVGEEGVGDGVVRPMVMSVGWNPVYKNVKRTAVCSLLR